MDCQHSLGIISNSFLLFFFISSLTISFSLKKSLSLLHLSQVVWRCSVATGRVVFCSCDITYLLVVSCSIWTNFYISFKMEVWTMFLYVNTLYSNDNIEIFTLFKKQSQIVPSCKIKKEIANRRPRWCQCFYC